MLFLTRTAGYSDAYKRAQSVHLRQIGKNWVIIMSSFAGHLRVTSRLFISVAALGAVGACSDGADFNLGEFLNSRDATSASVSRASTALETVERDVEAPEVFQAVEEGLWDGRPSLGGIWVAHPDVREPERVIIRNNSNDKFVVGALFRREREIPGPRLQISSDAAEALDVLAGAPVGLEVVALRKEQVAADGPADPEIDLSAGTPDDLTFEAPAGVRTATLDPLADVAADLSAADAGPEPLPEATQTLRPGPLDTAVLAQPEATAPAQSQPSALEKPFLQIGIFSVEDNAKRTADMMRNAGMIPIVKTFDRDGKGFWRVLVGPAGSETERSELLAVVKRQGFTDAYAVTN